MAVGLLLKSVMLFRVFTYSVFSVGGRSVYFSLHVCMFGSLIKKQRLSTLLQMYSIL